MAQQINTTYLSQGRFEITLSHALGEEGKMVRRLSQGRFEITLSHALGEEGKMVRRLSQGRFEITLSHNKAHVDVII